MVLYVGDLKFELLFNFVKIYILECLIVRLWWEEEKILDRIDGNNNEDVLKWIWGK